MDNIETLENTEDTTNFGVELGKAFALSAAASIGTIAGFVVIGAVVTKVKAVHENRAAKKNQKND